MIKTNPYILTFGTEEYKKLLLKPFLFTDIPSLFYGWKEKEMVNWVRYSYINFNLDVFSGYYEIMDGVKKRKFKLPHPLTINDFINDMNRLNIPLNWGKWIDEELKPNDFLEKSEIPEYYKKLLKQINKEHELIYNEE